MGTTNNAPATQSNPEAPQGTRSPGPGRVVSRCLGVLCGVVLLPCLLVPVHESGHVVVGILTGAKVVAVHLPACLSFSPFCVGGILISADCVFPFNGVTSVAPSVPVPHPFLMSIAGMSVEAAFAYGCFCLLKRCKRSILLHALLATVIFLAAYTIFDSALPRGGSDGEQALKAIFPKMTGK